MIFVSPAHAHIMSDLLFAYGTLIPGCEPAPMRPICTRMYVIGEATVRGILYDLDAFPGVVEGAGAVRGVVLRVPSDAWGAMDAYEGCPVPGGSEGLCKRIIARARLDSGEDVDCWLYVYARDVSGRRAVKSGDWRRRGPL